MAIPLPGVPALVDNAITRKLDHAWFPAITGQRDLKGQASLLLTGANGYVGKSVSPFGNVFDVTSSALWLFRIRRISTYPFVMCWAGWFNNASDNYSPIGLSVETGGGDQLTSRLISSSSVGMLQQNNFSSTANFGVTVTNLSANRVPVSVVQQSLSATDHRVYVNGSTNTSATNTGTFSPRHQFSIFSGVNTGTSITKTHSGGLFWASVGRTSLSEEEALWLSRPENIRGLLTRKRIWVPVSTSSGTTYTITPSGGVVLSGTGTQVDTKIIAPSGGISMGGTGTMTFGSAGTTYTITPSGGITMGGSGNFLKEMVIIPSGGVTMGGTGLGLRTKIVAPSGGVTLGGTGNMTSNTSPVAANAGERTKVGAGT